MSGKKLTEEQVIRALKRLERGWPKGEFWLFSASGDLKLMRCGPSGEHMMGGENHHEGVDPAYIVEGFSGIDSDGGGW